MRREEGFSLLGILVMVFIVISILILLFAVIGQFLGVFLFTKPCIAEIKIEDFISDRAPEESIFSPTAPPTSQDIAKLIEDANSREDVKAIVLYIDSPGGEVIATRELYEKVRDSKKPVVAYLRNVAASGGYYVAAGADYIVAEPETITGSIGVRVSTVSLERLLNNLGVNYTTIASGDKKDMGDIGRNLTEEERSILKEFVKEVFEEFKHDVYEGRKGHPRFSEENFEKVLDGRIISGKTAYSLGLVDELGNEEKAYRKAADLANIKEYSKCELSKRRGIFEAFMEEMSRGINVNVNLNGIPTKGKLSVSYG